MMKGVAIVPFLLFAAVDALAFNPVPSGEAVAVKRIEPIFQCSPTVMGATGVTCEVTRRKGDFPVRDQAVGKMSSLGVAVARVPMYWDVCFYEGAFRSGVYDEAMQTMRQSPFRMMGVLSKDFDRKTTAWSDPAAYISYVRNVVGRYRYDISDWEVFPGIDRAWSGGRKVTAQQYFSTLKATYSIVHQANPESKVVLGAIESVRGKFLDSLLAGGAHRYFDVFAFSSYGDPEGIIPQANGIRLQMNRRKWEKPVWLTSLYYGSAPVAFSDEQFYGVELPKALSLLHIKHCAAGVVDFYNHTKNTLNGYQISRYLKPVFSEVRHIRGSEAASADVPVLIPGNLISASVASAYLRAGGTLVLSEPKWPSVTHIAIEKKGYDNYLTDAGLSEGDEFVPVTYGPDGVVCAIYKLATGGNVLVQTRRDIVPYVDTEAEQAKRIARCYLLAYAVGIERVYWNGLRSKEEKSSSTASGGQKLTSKKDYAGLYYSDFSEKPAALAFAAMTKFLPSGSSRPVVEISGNIYLASWISASGEKCWAVWSPAGDSAGTGFGMSNTEAAADKKMPLKVSGKAQYYSHLGVRLKSAPAISDGVTYIIGPASVSF